jgi:hypothetical protein
MIADASKPVKPDAGSRMKPFTGPTLRIRWSLKAYLHGNSIFQVRHDTTLRCRPAWHNTIRHDLLSGVVSYA